MYYIVSTDCYNVIEGKDEFLISNKAIPERILSYYHANPDKRLDCVWDIRMPELTRVIIFS